VLINDRSRARPGALDHHGRQHADQQQAAPANGVIEQTVSRARQQGTEASRALQDRSLPPGRYACELIKEDSGQWRFSRRTVFHDHDYTLDGIGR
jgi:hypothetical protein